MTVNSLAPGFVIVFYSSNGHNHKHTIPIRAPIDTGGGIYTVMQTNLAAVALTTAMATWATAIKPSFPATTTLQYWELWLKATPSADPIFAQTADLSVVGTNGTAVVAYSQMIASYRTKEGGTGKVQLQEMSTAVNQLFKPPYSGSMLTLVTYLLGTTNIYAGRDGGFPVSVPKVSTKTNDKLRDKFLMDV